MPIARKCFLCGAAIYECMGSVLARDFALFNAGLRKAVDVRELCGKCALVQSELRNYADIPPFTEEERRFFANGGSNFLFACLAVLFLVPAVLALARLYGFLVS